MEPTSKHKHSVHKISAHSYSMHFIFFLIGVMLDIIFQIKIFMTSAMVPVGIASLLFGTVLVLWAQKTSRHLKTENLSKDSFYHGPYCYTRSPTHFGLFFIMMGFAVITNALFIALTTLVSSLIVRLVFIVRQERILAEKYGTHYLEYKKLVRF